MSQPPAHVSRSIVESFFEYVVRLGGCLGHCFSHSRLDVAVLEVLVSNIVTKCANSEVVDVLEV